MADIMKLMLEMSTRDKQERERREEEREEKALEREERRRVRDLEERHRREEEQARRNEKRDRETRDMLAALKDSMPTVPQTVHIENVKLPKMNEGEDAVIFVELFEAALTDNGITEDKWKGKLHAALDTTSKLKVRNIITDHDSTYELIKTALIGCGTLTFSASSEALMSADRGRTLSLPCTENNQTFRKGHS